MAKIGVIINPKAKKIRRMKADPAALYSGIGKGLVDARITKDAGDIRKAAKDFKKQKTEYLAISGGDGTIHYVLTEFIKVYKNEKLPRVLILRDGTMNNIARSVKLKGNGTQLLQKLVDAVNNGNNVQTKYRDTIKADGKYCFLFGFGLTTNYLRIYDGEGGGPGAAFKVLGMGVKEAITGKGSEGLFKRVKATITIDGKKLWFDSFIGVFAATVSTLNIGFAPTSRAYDRDGTFHVIASGMTPGEIVPRLNKLRRGISFNHPDHFDDIASRMTIKSGEKFEYVMDGDIYECSGSMEVAMGPGVDFVYI